MQGACRGDFLSVDEQVRQSVRKNLDLFDRSMEPGYLDTVVEELGKLKDHGGQGEPVREIRRYRLEVYFRLFRVVTEAIDFNYLPHMVGMMEIGGERKMERKDMRPIPEKVASAYLYHYL